MAYSRARREVKYHLRSTRIDNNVLKVYHVKNVYYGTNCDTYDYRSIKVTHKSKGRTAVKDKEFKKVDFAIIRAREKLYRIVEANKLPVKRSTKKNKQVNSIFFTLTTSDQLHSHKESNKKIKSFIKRLNLYCGFKIKYLIVPELHKSNAIHYHGIFFNLPFIPVEHFSKLLWKHGSVDLSFPRKIRSISAYISKYLTEDFQRVTPKYTKAYFGSRDLILPTNEFTDQHPDGILETNTIEIHQSYIKTKYTLCKKS